MITIKINGYKRNDIKILLDAFDIAFTSLECSEAGCDICGKKKVCEDIQRAISYLERIAVDLELFENG